MKGTKPTEETPFKREDFEQFDPRTIPKNFNAIVCGKRRTGKTVIVKDILSHVKDWYKTSYLFTETLDLQNVYDFVPKENRFNKFDEEEMEKIWNKQHAYVQREMHKNPNVDKSKLDHVLIILDDVISDPRVRQGKILNRIAIQSRHICLACILMSQTLSGRYGVNLVCRSNTDFIISFFPQSFYERKLIVEQFLSADSVKKGEEVLRAITDEDFHAIVIENYKTSRDYKETCKWYVGDLKVRDYIIGEEKKLLVDHPRHKVMVLPSVKKAPYEYTIVSDADEKW